MARAKESSTAVGERLLALRGVKMNFFEGFGICLICINLTAACSTRFWHQGWVCRLTEAAIGTKQTFRLVHRTSTFGGKADMAKTGRHVAF